jgi:hypothetical protein
MIGLITTNGTRTSFPLPPGVVPTGIVLGPDGNVWFTDQGLNQIGRLSPFSVAAPVSSPLVLGLLVTVLLGLGFAVLMQDARRGLQR